MTLKQIANAFSIALQGTMFECKPNKGIKSSEEIWNYSFDKGKIPPYVLTQDEYKIKNDLITKLHSVDNRLQETREENRRGRAKWLPDIYQQTYNPPAPPSMNNPQVEVYYRTLGLGMVRDPRITWTSLPR